MTTPAEIVEEARNGKDGGAILELLEQLEERLIELAAIKQAAKDYAIAHTNLTTIENSQSLFDGQLDNYREERLARLRANNETLQYLKDLVLD